MNCCYFASADEFCSINNDQWLAEMLRGYHSLCGEAPSPEQIAAWEDCKWNLMPLLEQCDGFDCGLIFEYELPREGGRRPDVLLFSGDVLFVLEFKRKNRAKRADVDQVEAYARDIRYYHSKSRGLEVIPVLVPTRTSGRTAQFGDVYVRSPDSLFALLHPKLSKEHAIELCDWLQAEYHPLPSLVNAAKLIYHNEPLPAIRKAHSAGIPEAVEALKNITKDAQENHKRVLALVTGVPGAGKTLLGLDFVYQSEGAVFLSGNRSLVAVLQYALDHKPLVAPLRNYVREYGIREKGIPKEHILVFDEAQRAWDRTQVYKEYDVDRSEPELIISVADRLPQWCVQLGLIGEGQEIHKGEEAGMIQWAQAIQRSQNKWQVVCPSKLASLFQGICEVIPLDALNLTISLRSHLAGDVAKWVNAVLDGERVLAKKLGETIQSQGFHIYITRNLESAKRFCKIRYEKEPEKRYGLIASSKSQILPRYDVFNDFPSTSELKVGPWFNEGIKDPSSCCNMDKVATEFACQGLELDMPILCWDTDLLWKDEKWCTTVTAGNVQNPYLLRLNSYRVLLTRGRDGLVVFVPNHEKLHGVYALLMDVGARELNPHKTI